jgi:hypothetical protein
MKNAHSIVNERGWNVHEWQLKEMLGLSRKAKLPAAGLPEQVVQGVTVWAKPLDPNRRQRAPHRMMARCPQCGKEMSAGRLFQHVCK